jgi:hypothetical protein
MRRLKARKRDGSFGAPPRCFAKKPPSFESGNGEARRQCRCPPLKVCFSHAPIRNGPGWKVLIRTEVNQRSWRFWPPPFFTPDFLVMGRDDAVRHNPCRCRRQGRRSDSAVRNSFLQVPRMHRTGPKGGTARSRSHRRFLLRLRPHHRLLRRAKRHSHHKPGADAVSSSIESVESRSWGCGAFVGGSDLPPAAHQVGHYCPNALRISLTRASLFAWSTCLSIHSIWPR